VVHYSLAVLLPIAYENHSIDSRKVVANRSSVTFTAADDSWPNETVPKPRRELQRAAMTVD